MSFSAGTAQEKIALFEIETTLWSLLVCPISAALCIVVITPWLKVLFGWLSKSAYERINSQDLKRESRYLSEKIELERKRAIELANQEKEIIDQAKRDEVVEKIENADLKKMTKDKIETLRKDKNDLANQLINKNLFKSVINLNDFEKDLLKYLSLSKDNFIRRGKDFQTGLFIQFNNQIINKNKDARSYLKWEEAIKSLIKNNFIYDLGGEGRIYELTDFGRDFIKKYDSF
ncbi:hypothetical protein SKM54_05000 [Acinetobacter faecalis]|uniref:hypothetical protein n=1 Tax=Acinetobacter faecalis TaxID=2665161 RepID=UPI002A912A59|nr:hypothetical protein [Acinetobacter faecalis]MDY6481809.1 hypothetical protein [Acinetobacter faecalis]